MGEPVNGEKKVSLLKETRHGSGLEIELLVTAADDSQLRHTYKTDREAASASGTYMSLDGKVSTQLSILTGPLRVAGYLTLPDGSVNAGAARGPIEEAVWKGYQSFSKADGYESCDDE